MKRYCMSFVPPLRLVRAAAIALLLVSLPLAATRAGAATSSAAASSAHVYLLRGVLNIFSLGLDEIAAKLHLLEDDLVVAVEGCDLRALIAGHKRGGWDPHQIRVGRDFELHIAIAAAKKLAG